ncbi:hypothetical protein FRB97_002454, partial [Tulasnella sp. 331]
NTDRSGKWFADIFGAVGAVGFGGYGELIDRASNDRLADLDINIYGLLFFKKFSAFECHVDAVITTQGVRYHADSEDDGADDSSVFAMRTTSVLMHFTSI